MSLIIRPRRNRKTSWLRDLVAQSSLQVSDFIYPLFVSDGVSVQREVKSMVNVFVCSLDLILKEVEKAARLGIKAINLFPYVSQELKTLQACHAFEENNLICRTIRAIKSEFNDQIGVICDVALDPYTCHGHDGILGDNGDVDNDKTLVCLAKQALVLAQSGADIVSPSDMMDGRVEYIRTSLDRQGFTDVGIMSYAVKYASGLYGPFRSALGSAVSLAKASKASYQMDVRNHKEAIHEIELDIAQSADIILIKPAIYSLDIIFDATQNFNVPIFAYQVSGEYAMIQSYADQQGLDFMQIMLESLLCIKRAGAKSIVSYAATQIAQFLTR